MLLRDYTSKQCNIIMIVIMIVIMIMIMIMIMVWDSVSVCAGTVVVGWISHWKINGSTTNCLLIGTSSECQHRIQQI